MEELPKIAEGVLVNAIRLVGLEGLEDTLWEFFRKVAAPDNLTVFV